MFASSAVLLKIYDEIDELTQNLAQASGLGCPRGCGTCCLSLSIEALPLEFLPLADELSRRGELNAALKNLELWQTKGDGCFWYRNAEDPIHGGHCSIYPWRPLLCRSFGYFPVLVRGQSKVLATCQILKESQRGAVANAQSWIDRQSATITTISDQSRRLALMDANLGRRCLLINDAAREALAFVSAQQFFASLMQDRDCSPTKPLSPVKGAEPILTL